MWAGVGVVDAARAGAVCGAVERVGAAPVSRRLTAAQHASVCRQSGARPARARVGAGAMGGAQGRPRPP